MKFVTALMVMVCQAALSGVVAVVDMNNYDVNNFTGSPITYTPVGFPAPIGQNIFVQVLGGPEGGTLNPLVDPYTGNAITVAIGAGNAGPGFFDAGVGVVPGVAPGVEASFQVLVWQGTNGFGASSVVWSGRSPIWTQSTGFWDPTSQPPFPPPMVVLQIPNLYVGPLTPLFFVASTNEWVAFRNYLSVIAGGDVILTGFQPFYSAPPPPGGVGPPLDYEFHDYQWLYQDTPIPGQTNATLTLSHVQTNQAGGSYALAMRYGVYDRLTNNVFLDVLVPPAILEQPQSQTVVAGTSALFTVAASGTHPLSYQWLFNASPIAGAYSSSFIKANAQSADAGQYVVVITNLAGSVTSAVAALAVIVPPTIAAGPASQTIAQGSNVAFTVVASGTAPLGYQWLFNGTPIAGATAASLIKGNVQPLDAGQYSVTVTNLAGTATSGTAVLTVVVPPAITIGPASQTIAQGSNVTFSVVATGTAPLGYQWLFNAAALAGQTNATLFLANVQTNQAGAYSVAVSNSAGSTTSSNAILAVTVISVSPPTITSAKLSGGTFSVAVSTQAGHNYVFEFKSSLSDADWTVVQTTSGTGGAVNLVDPSAAGNSRFYRVRVE